MHSLKGGGVSSATSAVKFAVTSAPRTEIFRAAPKRSLVTVRPADIRAVHTHVPPLTKRHPQSVRFRRYVRLQFQPPQQGIRELSRVSQAASRFPRQLRVLARRRLRTQSDVSLGKVISGGQTGVDQAALWAAIDCGLAIGGWCPPGRVCEAGAIPPEFPLEETEQDRSVDAPDVPRSQRTEWNVRDSDGMLVLAGGPPSYGYGVAGSSESVRESIDDAATEDTADPGTDWAIQCAKRYGRPLLVCDVADPDAKQNTTHKWAFSTIPSQVGLGTGGCPSRLRCPFAPTSPYDYLC